MRLLPAAAFGLALALAAPLAALAAPATVQVRLDPKLEKLAVTRYGEKEVQDLASRLKTRVERALARTGALPDATVELVLEDAMPNRPTMQELGAKPGLSMESFGVGGARISGRVVQADGAVTPVSYAWYETDIRQAQDKWTWSDAEWTFDRFASRLSQGKSLASR